MNPCKMKADWVSIELSKGIMKTNIFELEWLSFDKSPEISLIDNLFVLGRAPFSCLDINPLVIHICL